MNLYDVDEWDGEKYVVFTTTNIFGGKNVFIGILFIVAGAVCFVSALIYMLRYVLGSKVDYTDLSNLKWN